MNYLVRAIPRRKSTQPAEHEPLVRPETPAAALPPPAAIPEDDGREQQEQGAGSALPWVEYAIFGFLGVAMLWATNMLLAAAPYFALRFRGDEWIETNFPSAILTVSTTTKLATVLVLASMRRRTASHTFRISLALVSTAAAFTLLTASTAVFLDVSARAYLAFVLFVVAVAALSTALLQTSGLALAAGLGRPEYMQAVVTGQSIAGVLPALSEIVIVLAFPPRHGVPVGEKDRRTALMAEGKKSAFFYFLAAVFISTTAMAVMVPLSRRYKRNAEYRSVGQTPAAANDLENVVPMAVLFGKLRFLACGIVVVFAATMFFPVFTAHIRSVPGSKMPAGLSADDAFIPLAFLCWNLGDFGGRLWAAMFSRSGGGCPQKLFSLAVLRILQLPLYLLCNIRNRGAVVSSDFFYLLFVQLPFGFTNGWLCSRILTLAGCCVHKDEREAAGAFMGLCLICGLVVGSLLSFMASNA